MNSEQNLNEDAGSGSALNDVLGLVDDLRTEADLCRNETADDIANLLDHAADEIEKLRDAANVALGHLTGGMDGDWRDTDPVQLLRDALMPNALK